MTDPLHLVRAALAESVAVKQRFDEELCSRIVRAAAQIACALRAGSKVVLFGNGGSAADAQHIAAELIVRFGRERPAWPALALNVNSSVLTAAANDYGFVEVFARQVRGLVAEGDVVIGITTSGASENVVRGLAAARERDAYVIAMTGEVGGAVAHICDLLLAVPSRATPRIQEAHITIGHILCELVEHELAG